MLLVTAGGAVTTDSTVTTMRCWLRQMALLPRHVDGYGRWHCCNDVLLVTAGGTVATTCCWFQQVALLRRFVFLVAVGGAVTAKCCCRYGRWHAAVKILVCIILSDWMNWIAQTFLSIFQTL